jgi:putative peptidoglycan lipid II flippase
MAVATLISRITGFLRQLALAAVLGLGVVNDSYTVANTLPAMLYEILLGGVLTSVIVPLLVRAAKEIRIRARPTCSGWSPSHS